MVSEIINGFTRSKMSQDRVCLRDNNLPNISSFDEDVRNAQQLTVMKFDEHHIINHVKVSKLLGVVQNQFEELVPVLFSKCTGQI